MDTIKPLQIKLQDKMAKFIEAAQDLETELAAFLRDAPDSLFEQFEYAGLQHIGARVSRIKNDIFIQRKRIQVHDVDTPA